MKNKFRTKYSSSLPIIILIFLALIWGSSFILIKRGLDTFSPDQVGTLRIAFAFVVLLPIAIKYLNKHFKGNWFKFFLFGLISNLMPAVLFSIAETSLSSSLTGILNALTPMFTLLIGAISFGAGFNKSQVTGLIIGFAGSVILTFVGSEGGLGSFNFYAVYVVIATVCYGIGANMVKKYFSKVNSLILTSLALFTIGPFSLIYLLSTDFLWKLSNTEGAWASFGYIFILGAVGTALALIFFNKLIQNTTPVFASTVTYLIPIVAVIWGIIDGESLFPLHFLGMTMIIAGVYVVNMKRSKS